MYKTLPTDSTWLSLVVLPGKSLGINRTAWPAHVGKTSFVVDQRRRRRGTYIDNSFATWYETWVSQDGTDLGYMDTIRYPPPKWDVTEGSESWVGVLGEVVGFQALIAKPYRVGLKRTPLVSTKVGDRTFVLNRRGELTEEGELVAQIGPKAENGVRADSDDVVWVLALLLRQIQVPQSFEQQSLWETLLDPVLIGELFFNWG